MNIVNLMHRMGFELLMMFEELLHRYVLLKFSFC